MPQSTDNVQYIMKEKKRRKIEFAQSLMPFGDLGHEISVVPKPNTSWYMEHTLLSHEYIQD